MIACVVRPERTAAGRRFVLTATSPDVEHYDLFADGPPFHAGPPHIEPVESKLVVNWNHSLQDRPEIIEDIRRILRLNIGQGMQTQRV